ncbi:MAG TPA: hypothetical protein VFC78_14810 [Tepidisphaeraceae bacterium]|nr:hypothetical protein [Tepidisphaeraceae bacterium]
MTAMSNAEFAEHVTKLARSAPAFEPTVTYDPDGDCIEFLLKPDSFYGARIDDLVTVYYSQESNEIIGSLIKGVNGFLKKHPGLQIDIQDGRVCLVHLFRASYWNKQNPQQIESRTYRKLIEVAEQANAEAELECV